MAARCGDLRGGRPPRGSEKAPRRKRAGHHPARRKTPPIKWRQSPPGIPAPCDTRYNHAIQQMQRHFAASATQEECAAPPARGLEWSALIKMPCFDVDRRLRPFFGPLRYDMTLRPQAARQLRGLAYGPMPGLAMLRFLLRFPPRLSGIAVRFLVSVIDGGRCLMRRNPMSRLQPNRRER